VPARFSTVLVQTEKAGVESDKKGPLGGVSWLLFPTELQALIFLPGLSVAKVQVIFKLPEQCGICTTPLVYMHWMKPLHKFTAGLGMYEVSFSSHNRQQRASIIPLMDIVQTCHLIPVFGRASAWSLGWTAETVLHEATSFYLNLYLHHRDFYFLWYRLEMYLLEEDQRQEQIRLSQIQQGRKRARPYRPEVA